VSQISTPDPEILLGNSATKVDDLSLVKINDSPSQNSPESSKKNPKQISDVYQTQFCYSFSGQKSKPNSSSYQKPLSQLSNPQTKISAFLTLNDKTPPTENSPALKNSNQKPKKLRKLNKNLDIEFFSTPRDPYRYPSVDLTEISSLKNKIGFLKKQWLKILGERNHLAVEVQARD
jgi:hypothetical protein